MLLMVAFEALAVCYSAFEPRLILSSKGDNCLCKSSEMLQKICFFLNLATMIGLDHKLISDGCTC